jgi:hypothetical protein
MGKTEAKRVSTRKSGRPSRHREHPRRGSGDLHAEGDEEEGDEEVADGDDLRDHVEVVGERGHADPGDEGAHLPERPRALATPATRKHQASAVTSSSSGTFAMNAKRAGSR